MSLNSRQLDHRAVLSQLFPYVTNATLDLLLTSIDADLSVPLRIDATNSPSLVLNVGPSLVANPISDRQKSIPFINSLIPDFTGGTVTFPSSSGGNITTSTGGSTVLTCGSGQSCAVLLLLDSSGNLLALPGTPAASPSLAVVPSPTANTLPIGYIIISNVAGVIQPIPQASCYQFGAGAGGGSGGGGGVAESVAVSSGETSITITLPSEQSSSNYVVLAQLSNLIDSSVQYQPITITGKSPTGFVATWNGPTESANYHLDYAIAPGLSEQAGEAILTVSTTSATIVPPIALTNANYVVIAGMVNIIDANPAFQPVTTVMKSTGSFTVSWNAALPTSNYRLAWQLASYT